MTLQLSPLTHQLVEYLFEPSDQAEASRRLVEECGNNLPFCQNQDEYQLERIRFAALRISIGYLDDLQEAVNLAKRDWRDVLVWAGFGESLTAHQEWAQQTLKGNAKPMVLIVTGVTGAGKTTVGSLLARRLGWMYMDFWILGLNPSARSIQESINPASPPVRSVHKSINPLVLGSWLVRDAREGQGNRALTQHRRGARIAP